MDVELNYDVMTRGTVAVTRFQHDDMMNMVSHQIPVAIVDSVAKVVSQHIIEKHMHEILLKMDLTAIANLATAKAVSEVLQKFNHRGF